MPVLALLIQEAAHGGEEPFTPFSINTGLIFWTLVVFGVLLALLWKLGWPAILKSVEERERRIQQQLDDAEPGRGGSGAPAGGAEAAVGGGAGGGAGDCGPCQDGGAEGAGSAAGQSP